MLGCGPRRHAGRPGRVHGPAEGSGQAGLGDQGAAWRGQPARQASRQALQARALEGWRRGGRPLRQLRRASWLPLAPAPGHARARIPPLPPRPHCPPAWTSARLCGSRTWTRRLSTRHVGWDRRLGSGCWPRRAGCMDAKYKNAGWRVVPVAAGCWTGGRGPRPHASIPVLRRRLHPQALRWSALHRHTLHLPRRWWRSTCTTKATLTLGTPLWRRRAWPRVARSRRPTPPCTGGWVAGWGVVCGSVCVFGGGGLRWAQRQGVSRPCEAAQQDPARPSSLQLCL